MVSDGKRLATFALLATALASSTAFAQVPGDTKKSPPDLPSTDEAATHFKRGMDLYEEGDPSAALIEFKRAQAIAPHPRVLYNIGQVSFQLQDYAGALKAFSELLAWRDTAAVTQERRAEVEREVLKLRSRVGSLRVESRAAGAEVAIDDVPQGTTPLAAPLLVSAGRRRISLLVPGRQAIVRTVDVAGGDAATVRIDPPHEERTERTEPGPSTEARTSTWVAWGITGTLAATTTVVGILALGASSDLAAQRDRRDVSQGELAGTHDRMRSLAVATDVLGAATVVAGAVSVYLTLRRATTAEPHTSPAAAVGMKPGGMAFELSF